MRWLFIHQDLPGQFRHVMRHLAALGHDVVGIGRNPETRIEGAQVWSYRPRRAGSEAHAYVREFDLAVHNGLAVADVCTRLKTSGYVPHVAVGHNGWGEIFFAKDVWPSMPLVGYFEFFYRLSGSDAD
ncbi:MAG: glycosyl transferase family 1, partial [Methanobacterium sp.]|nr:glycosyl transferase family 1 [Methanobacterium sp.]